MALEPGTARVDKTSGDIFGPYSVSYRYPDGETCGGIYGLSKLTAEELAAGFNSGAIKSLSAAKVAIDRAKGVTE